MIRNNREGSWTWCLLLSYLKAKIYYSGSEMREKIIPIDSEKKNVDDFLNCRSTSIIDFNECHKYLNTGIPIRVVE